MALQDGIGGGIDRIKRGYGGRSLLGMASVLFCLAFPAAAVTATGEDNSQPQGKRLYAHEKINVRRGPGLGYEVMWTLVRGNAVDVGRVKGEWGEIRRGGECGYVMLKLLEPKAVPPLEIVRWDWRKAPRTGRRGVVVWVVEVRNNADRPVEHVQVELRTFDRKGKLIDRDITHLRGIGPGQIAGSRAFATYSGREASAKVELLGLEGAGSAEGG